MELAVDPEIWERFPRLRILLLTVEDVDNRSARPALARELEESMAALRAGWSLANPQSHPRIAAWRELQKGLGFSGKKFPSSIEALARRVLSGKGLASINPLVDLYNRISLTHLVPAGGWDLDDLDRAGSTLRLALTAGGERFRALGAERAVAVEPGEAAYLVGGEVVTRHFVWRQSELGKLTGDTRRALLISECLEAVDDRTALAVAGDLESGVAAHFGVEARSVVVTAAGAGDRSLLEGLQ